MSRAVDLDLLVPRTCTESGSKNNECGSKRESQSLADFRAEPAYVLLGDPGAGKTKSFEQEATATGGHYIRARSFATLDPSPELIGKTLFIDGLDEIRAGVGDGRTPLDHVRRHLDRLGRPRFRLSCREADWYGDSDGEALREVAPNGELKVLHLDLLQDADVILLLERKFSHPDPAEFVRQANRHGLADLLRNPQTLDLLVKAVGDKDWPESRDATYELACQQLVREENKGHRDAKRGAAPAMAVTEGGLLDAAGFLCAVHLLAGIAGFALDDDAADAQHMLLSGLGDLPRELPLIAALGSGLFQRDEREQQRIPIHRSIAEYLGARYLAAKIAAGLPLGRVIALMAGDDGGIVVDLRGLVAWLAVHCRSGRVELIARDPLGVVLYGDVRGFPLDDKRHVLSSLKDEAERYANFRFEHWVVSPFGALETPDMVPVFQEILAASSRSAADMALLSFVLDALRYGPPLVELVGDPVDAIRLEALLDAAVRDASYPAHIRDGALKVLLRDRPRNAARLLAMACDIRAGQVKDEDGQILGRLLMALFPEYIPPAEIFDFLHSGNSLRHTGDYFMFWMCELPKKAPAKFLPELLDQLVERVSVSPELYDGSWVDDMIGSLLAQALDAHGNTIDDARRYDWLGIGIDRYGCTRRINREHKKQIAVWLATRPERYKAVLLTGIARCTGQEDFRLFLRCMFNSTSRLYGAEPPADIVPWYLEHAAHGTHDNIKRYFFEQAVRRLIEQAGQEWLTPEALDYLAPWLVEHPEFELDLQQFTSCAIDDWRREHAIKDRDWENGREQQKKDWRNHFHEHLAAIRDGSAHPQILHELAQVYLRSHLDIPGKTPRERLANFLGDDAELIAAAYSGFRFSLERNDLPSVAEIVDLEAKGRMYFIRQPCLAGMEELYASDPDSALHLGDAVLRKLLAFRLTWIAENEPKWFMALVKTRPDLSAEVLVAYVLPLLRKGHDHLHGVWALNYSDDFAAVARISLPDLLKGFPLRAKNKQLANVLDPLLKAALRYLEPSALATIVSARLAQGSMSAAQRVYWLACGLLIAPVDYEAALAAHIGASKVLCGHLGNFMHDRERGTRFNTVLPESSLALLIELLAPDSPPERPLEAHWVSAAMQVADAVRVFINTLGGKPSEAATQQLERLLSLPRLAPWRPQLRDAAQAQRSARRKANFRHLDVREVCRTLANREPANAADLAALVDVHLRDLARSIRNGSTNDYRQYWNHGKHGVPMRPKLENDCRDMLLSDLKERLGRLGVDAIREGSYAEDKRADIRVSFGGTQGFNVPIEIKKDSHNDLWRAMHEQLIARYTRDPGADGFGIYLVFWFGGKNMPQQGKRPRSAAELEAHLRQTLSAEERHRIKVCVIDCALPGDAIERSVHQA